MRWPAKTLAWSFAAVMPIMICDMALPLHAADSSLRNIKDTWHCNHTPNLDPQVCHSTEDGVIRYRIVTADGIHTELMLSNEGILEEIQPAGTGIVHVRFGHAPTLSSVAGMASRAYEDEILSIDEVRYGQHAPALVIHSRDDRSSRFLIEMCQTSACGGNIK